jgi:uncharacterized protein (DUF2062 family)
MKNLLMCILGWIFFSAFGYVLFLDVSYTPIFNIVRPALAGLIIGSVLGGVALGIAYIGSFRLIYAHIQKNKKKREARKIWKERLHVVETVIGKTVVGGKR